MVRVREGRVQLDVDLWHGQKTGMFLDQRENHAAAARYARGRALDAFSYNGGFALQLAAAPKRVLALDASEEAVKGIQRNAALNGIGNIEARAANVFDELRDFERAGERFDTIVLDPPAFAKSRAALTSALSGYKEINLRALKLLRPGGILVTCSCSYHLDEATFGQVVYESGRRRAGGGDGGREADAGARPPGRAGRARDVLPEVPRPAAAAVGVRPRPQPISCFSLVPAGRYVASQMPPMMTAMPEHV